MRIAFLAGRDSASTRLAIEAVCRVDGVRPAAILLDVARLPRAGRWRNLRRNVRREGLSYLPHRAVEALYGWVEARAARVVDPGAVTDLLRQAFPERAFSLEELGERRGCPVIRIDHLNSAAAAAALRDLNVDLGIVVGTRILKPSTFTVPRLGCVNLHKGKVPEYRGLPPGFWELYDGASTAGVTVHFVDAGLDTGDIVGTIEVPIADSDTEVSLRAKLDLEGAKLLARCVSELQAGCANRRPQPGKTVPARTNPTRRQRLELERRAPGRLVQPRPWRQIVKTGAYLGFYSLRFPALVRGLRRWRGVSRGVILLYHRVNDLSVDSLTASSEAFAAHLALLKRCYRVRSTSWLLERLVRREPVPPDTVLIHFDDCYRDVYTHAAPLLAAAGLPATAFVASGFIGTARAFEHDRRKSPFAHENMAAAEVRGLLEHGFEVGAHTVNHANLGGLPVDAVKSEVFGSREQLETVLGRPVEFFSFPFGRMADITPQARAVIEQAGFKALFSAYGGTVTRDADLFDLPRRGASSEHRPLDLIMEIEGLALGDLAARLGLSKRAHAGAMGGAN